MRDKNVSVTSLLKDLPKPSQGQWQHAFLYSVLLYSVHVHSDGDVAQGMLLIPLIKVHSWGHSEHISLQVTPALGFWPDSFPRLCRYRRCLKIGHPELPSLFWAKIPLQTYLFKVYLACNNIPVCLSTDLESACANSESMTHGIWTWLLLSWS